MGLGVHFWLASGLQIVVKGAICEEDKLQGWPMDGEYSRRKVSRHLLVGIVGCSVASILEASAF